LWKNISRVSATPPLNLILLDPGDYVEADEVIARIETDKVTVDIASPEAGVIQKYFAAEGDTVSVGADFFDIDTDAKAGSSAPAQPKPAETPAPEAPKAEAPPTQTPAAAPPKAAPAQAPPVSTPPPQPSGSGPQSVTAKKPPTEITGTRVETRVPMNRMRLKISERLKDA
jgi:2-oxoglutarate dehydrogenase E2 component (dihydrolipoamide succinyltransferase)